MKWLGLSNWERQQEMEARKSPYDAEWEGCFEENPEIKPLTGIYFNDEELNAFLFSLGCYEGEAITVIAHRKSGCTVSIKDARYSFDKDLAEAIVVA